MIVPGIISLNNNETPRKDTAPHSITESPPCFTVETRQLTRNAFDGACQTNTRPLVWNNVNKDSLEQKTCSHCNCILFRWSLHHSNLFITFGAETIGFRIANLQ
ncbi:hypothetical protein TNCV_4948691 [Trichonephila clavipes]|nr:hypothetical protein TNCV_4948691 [Trichonephila clavipes]